MRLAVIEGDGIGREVIPAAVKVLDAFGLEFEKVTPGAWLYPVGKDRNCNIK